MKKLIAISVVFALAAGVAFAVDLSGEVIATVNVITADSGGDVGASAGFKHIRVQGGGELADGKFGGWLRIDPTSDGTFGDIGIPLAAGLAWWKPIDQLKITIGGNPDGIFAKEGVTCWMFYQGVSDTGVVTVGNAWGGGYSPWPLVMRKAFWGGIADPELMVEITPVDMVSINIGLPFFTAGADTDIKKVFLGAKAQVSLNMSFGNIAFSFDGNPAGIEKSRVYGFFSLTAIDNLGLDFGIGTNFEGGSGPDDNLYLGVGGKYSGSSWGIKFRTLFAIPTRSTQDVGWLCDVLPYFVINDSFRVFVSTGVAFWDAPTITLAWHVNPYIEIGEEWGPKFFVGLKVYGNSTTGGGGSSVVNFELPVAISLSF